MVQKESLDNTIFIDLDLPFGFESINPGSIYNKDSILPVLIYESSRLLVKYPALNSSVNVIITGIDTGLKVVKIQQPDKMNLKEIEEKLVELSNSNPDKKSNSSSDLSSITFTVSDLIANGVYFLTPSANSGHTSILAISKFDKKLNRITLSLTFDQRVTETKIGIAFLGELKERIMSYISLQKVNTGNLMCHKCMRRISEDLNGKGFIKVMTNKGEEKLICDSCLFNY